MFIGRSTCERIISFRASYCWDMKSGKVEGFFGVRPESLRRIPMSSP